MCSGGSKTGDWGKFSSKRRPPRGGAPLGGESYHMWVDDQVCGFQARIHYIRCVFGHVAGCWPSVIKIGDVTIHRQGHQRRPDA